MYNWQLKVPYITNYHSVSCMAKEGQPITLDSIDHRILGMDVD